MAVTPTLSVILPSKVWDVFFKYATQKQLWNSTGVPLIYQCHFNVWLRFQWRLSTLNISKLRPVYFNLEHRRTHFIYKNFGQKTFWQKPGANSNPISMFLFKTWYYDGQEYEPWRLTFSRIKTACRQNPVSMSWGCLPTETVSCSKTARWATRKTTEKLSSAICLYTLIEK